MRKDTADRLASSHAGQHGDFEIAWVEAGDWMTADKRGVLVDCEEGWYIGAPFVQNEDECGDTVGPYATSQEAFCDVKNAIDAGISA